jgi:galactokinase
VTDRRTNADGNLSQRSVTVQRAVRAVFVPARVNLIGEHTDYSGGLVLPVAIDLGVTLAWRPGPDSIRVRSDAFCEPVELACDGGSESPLPSWGRYVAAVARLLHECGRPSAGLEGTITATVPIGAGLSSSAAFSVAVALALCRAADFELPAVELARLVQAAELTAVGVPCGLMDPAAALLGRRGHALLLDCSTEEHRLIRLPPDVAIVVIDSGVRRDLEHSGYAKRRAEVERGAGEVAERRRRHVVSENERVRRCVAELEAPGGVDLLAIGTLFRESHKSLRDDFEVSTPELDLLVDLADHHGAYAARMTGGGFGGSIVVLVDAGRASALVGGVAGAYLARTGREATGYVCASTDGAAA